MTDVSAVTTSLSKQTGVGLLYLRGNSVQELWVAGSGATEQPFADRGGKYHTVEVDGTWKSRGKEGIVPFSSFFFPE